MASQREQVSDPASDHLAQGLPGRLRRTPWGSCYELEFCPRLVRQRLGQLPQFSSFPEERTGRIPPGVSQPLELLRQRLPGGVLFVDLETCGFLGSPVFLVGVVYLGRKLVGRQYLARDWSEEPAILYQFWKHLRRRGVLVSFNGKSFDWPMLLQRTIYHHPQGYAALQQHLQGHCDLLHLARRLWRDRLPNCRLKTLERHVCRYHRAEDDIPGWAIPEAYRRFVTRGETDELERIVYHNQMDLLTLVDLCQRMLRLLGEG